MRRLALLVGRLRILKRLRALEEKVSLMHPCHDCGGWVLPGHRAVGLTPNGQGQLEPRCKWDQAAYEGSALKRAREAAQQQNNRRKAG